MRADEAKEYGLIDEVLEKEESLITDLAGLFRISRIAY
jgi:enoyl-CoA hydratase/carnithine racemase